MVISRVSRRIVHVPECQRLAVAGERYRMTPGLESRWNADVGDLGPKGIGDIPALCQVERVELVVYNAGVGDIRSALDVECALVDRRIGREVRLLWCRR